MQIELSMSNSQFQNANLVDQNPVNIPKKRGRKKGKGKEL